MKAPSTCRALVVAIAGCAGSLAPLAHAEDPLLAPEAPIPAPISGYVYINARTGERVYTPAPNVSRSEFIPRFTNEDSGSNGSFFSSLDTPTRLEREMVNWGDVDFDTSIDAFTFAYATKIPAPHPDGIVPGLSTTIWWTNCDNGSHDPNIVPLWSITVQDLRGALDPTLFDGWVYTVDMQGSGLEFEIGDTDGSFVGVTGAHSTGCDRDDTDGSPMADFSWSYTFDQDQAGPPGTIGPFLALPASAGNTEDDYFPTGATGQSRGIADRFDFYTNPSGGTHEVFLSTSFMGGWPVAPYASSWIGLYGSNPRDCGPADFNGDTLVDILDFLDFIDDFSNCEGQPAPCGTIANTDLGGDTIVDILDFLDFFDVFAACE